MRARMTFSLTIAVLALAAGVAPTPGGAADLLVDAPIGSLRVERIRLDGTGVTALMAAPSGGRSLVAVGDSVGRERALVVEIDQNGVVVEERFAIREGQEVVNRVSLPLSGGVVETLPAQ